MVRIRRILRDYADAGSVNTLLALWGFVDESTFLTKAGHVGIVYQVTGVNYEGLSHDHRRELVHRVEAALRLLDERCRLYQYVIKSTAARFDAAPCAHPVAHEAIQRRAAYLNERREELYDLALYWVLLYEPANAARRSTTLRRFWTRPGEAVRGWLSTDHAVTVLRDHLDRAIATLHHKAQSFEVQLTDIGLARLAKRNAFAFFRRLVNDPARAAAATLTHDAHLDYFVADSAVECHRDCLMVGHRHVKVLSMKEPPGHTFPLVLRDLYAIHGEFVACLEWQRIGNDRMRRDLQSRRRHFFNRRVALVNYVSPDTRPDEMLVDDSAAATVHQLGDALTELEVNGHFFGSCSLTIVLHGHERRAVEHQAAEAMKVMASHDGQFLAETYNLLNAWLGVVPGNAVYNLRRLALLETNAADLSFIFTLDSGAPGGRQPGDEPLVTFETPHRVPYAFSLHVEDVGHSLVLGATGSGKSFLVNFLITHAQQYDPFTVILDIGGSYERLASLLRGRYVPIGLRHDHVTINPFALDGTPEHLHFLHAFVRVLLEGSNAHRLSAAEDREIYEAIESLFVLEPGQRRLFTLANMLPRALGSRLHRWVDGGRYGSLFDNVTDTLSLEPLQVFDFAGMADYPDLLEPLLFYMLYRITERVQDPARATTLKICVMDEAWRFIQHPALRAYVHEGLKTWRKRNAAMLLATQSVEDFASADLLRTVVEGCPTKLFLANPALDREHYAELFGLNEVELELLTGLVPRREILLKRPDVTRVLTLTVDPRSYGIYTNTPIDNETAVAIFREDSLDTRLDHLAPSA